MRFKKTAAQVYYGTSNSAVRGFDFIRHECIKAVVPNEAIIDSNLIDKKPANIAEILHHHLE